MFKINRRASLLLLPLLFVLSATLAAAQGTAFTYQGRLQDGGTAANGSYDFQFTLWDAPAGGVQQPPTGPITLTRTSVQVVNGVFTTQLDFGASVFPGADRFLEIGVRLSGGGAFTILSSRQSITVTPYAIRSASAAAADTAINATTATTATNATQLGGVAAAQYVLSSDSRLTDARPPTSGSSSYIQNTTTTQAGSNFNISGNGTAAGTLSGYVVNATTQFNLNASRVLSTVGVNNLFVGFNNGGANTSGTGNSFFGQNAGAANKTGSGNSFFGSGAGASNTSNSNSFFGVGAGFANTSGNQNSFFGGSVGYDNTSGFDNSFFGALAGRRNTTGNSNSFYGALAGRDNVDGYDNSFFGASAGASSNAVCCNSFFGSHAGYDATTGIGNTFFGWYSGEATTTGNGNTFVGYSSGDSNATGSNNTIVGNLANVGANNLNYATAIGAGATVSTSNSIVLGRSSGTDKVRVPGLGTATATHLCIDTANQNELSLCSSSLRYKQNVLPLAAGLNLLQRLRPVTFNWKESNLPDLGLIAEEVAVIEPLLVTLNPAGEIQGVKYDQLNVVLINAIKQQQAQIQGQAEQIKQQQLQINSLKSLVCLDHPNAEVCK